jgi:para-nitrobenzyl esterase
MTAFNAKETITIQLPGGKISALIDGNLIHARGIRYANAAHFHRPHPVADWGELGDCTRPAPSSPQNKEALMIANGSIREGRAHSEDCLRVNVVAPVGAQNAPVMVYLHGGAYITGGGDYAAYTPWGLASRGVVAVTVTYRLGLFGCLPIPGVAPANLGLIDQIEALKWVKKNAAAFGGSADNVTVFGQSAGGDSIYCLLVADGTDDLFQQCILQSAPIPSRLHESNRVEMTVAMSGVVQQFFTKNPYDCPVEALLALEEQTIEIGRKYSDTLANYAPIFGSYPLPPDYELPERIASAARRKRIFLGVTEHEGTPFAMIRRNMDLAAQITRVDFRDGINEMHRQVESAIGGPSPMFVFS